MAESVVKVVSACLLLLTPALFLDGCGRSQAYPTYMNPGLLYLKDQPYRKLYVEVDMVEGADVPLASDP